jgi:hypothetical protein
MSAMTVRLMELAQRLHHDYGQGFADSLPDDGMPEDGLSTCRALMPQAFGHELVNRR